MSQLIVYNASAGSGKTYTLAREYILQIIKSPVEYRSVLAVTFTNKATEEMKSRIVKELHTLANYKPGESRDTGYLPFLAEKLAKVLNAPSQEALYGEISGRAQRVLTAILHDYSNFAISTIDKFFQKVVRNFVRELNIQPGYELELDSDRVLTLAVDKVLEGLHEDEALQRWLFDLVEERLNDGSSWELSGILGELGKQLMREEFRVQDEAFYAKINDKDYLDRYFRKLVAWRKQAEQEYRDAGAAGVKFLQDNGIDEKDTPGGSRGFATIFAKAMNGDVPSSYKTVEDAYCNPDKWMAKGKPKMTDAVYSYLNPLMGKILDYLNGDRTTYDVAIKNFRTLGVLADIDRQVRELASEDNLLLISDTNYIVSKLIDGTDAPFIYEKMGNRYTSYMIDEFQDTSMQQYSNFRPLLENSLAQGGYAMVVGDVKQNIYRWRGGSWETLGVEVKRDFSFSEVTLDTNFRSRRNVVDFNNLLFPRLAAELDTKFSTALSGSAGAEDAIESTIISSIYKDVCQKVPDSPAKEGGYVCLEMLEATEEMDTAALNAKVMQKMVGRISELQDERGYRPSDIAILVRTQKEGQMVAEALLEARNSSEEALRGRFSFISQGALYLSSSTAVNLIISVLRLSVNTRDSISAALLSYIEKLEQDTAIVHGYFESTVNEKAAEVIARIANLPLPEAVEVIIGSYRLNTIIDELPFIGGFCDTVLGFASRKLSDVSSFLAWWDDRGSSAELYLPNQEEAITVLTIHKSKGLQYKVVLMPFTSWEIEPPTGGNRKKTLWVSGEPLAIDGDYLDVIPIDYSQALLKSRFADAGSMEKLQTYIDNINLAYVALTRAEEELYVYIPKRKRKAESIGDIIFGVVSAIPEVVQEEGDDEACLLRTYGTKGQGSGRKESGEQALPLRSFKIGTPLSKIKQSYSTTVAEGKGNLKKGLLMHRLFSMVSYPEDIPQALDTLVEEGLMLDEERGEVTEQVRSKLQDPVVASWFSRNYRITTEGDIIMPGEDYRVRRPDRVMQGADETVVVDFKFGDIEDEKHRYQVFGYINTLKKMGYPNVRGYLWYFDTNKVIALE